MSVTVKAVVVASGRAQMADGAKRTVQVSPVRGGVERCGAAQGPCGRRR
jgi:hypothetical protein